jgi:hypothetical protein
VVRLDRLSLRALDEAGVLYDPRFFTAPWAPRRAASVFDAWKTVVEDVEYDRRTARALVRPGTRSDLEQEAGVCFDTAALLAAWLLSRGENAFVGIEVVDLPLGAGTGDHAWVVLRDSRRKETLLLEAAMDTKLM